MNNHPIHPDEDMEVLVGQKRCGKCLNYKHLSEFSRNNENKGHKRCSYCTKCKAIDFQERMQADPEGMRLRNKERQRKYRLRQKEKQNND